MFATHYHLLTDAFKDTAEVGMNHMGCHVRIHSRASARVRTVEGLPGVLYERLLRPRLSLRRLKDHVERRAFTREPRGGRIHVGRVAIRVAAADQGPQGFD